MFGSKFNTLTVYTILLIATLVLGIIYNDYSPWWIVLTILCYLTLVVLGSIKIQWNFYLTSQNRMTKVYAAIEKGKMNIKFRGKEVVLTFDDGPSENTEAVLDILKQANIKAIFFVIGKNIAGKEHIIRRMNKEGHIVGNHSFLHGFSFDWQSSKKMAAEILDTNNAISSITRNAVTMFRPPYGVTNPMLAKAIKQTGMKSIGWNVRSMDTVAHSEEKLIKRIISRIQNGSIILLHDRCDITVKILPQLIKELTAKSYKFGMI